MKQNGKKIKERTCRVCGCTDNNCLQCIEKTGFPCYWVEDDLCSVCVEEVEEKISSPLKAQNHGNKNT